MPDGVTRYGAVLLLLAVGSSVSQAQGAGAFAPGGQELALLDFTTFPLGVVPTTPPAVCRPGTPVLCDITGDLAVVMHDGQPMLRASDRSWFVIRLPQRLPSDFTLEFDLVPKTCCQPEDLAFEGTRTITQSAVSANVLWHHSHHAIVGGIKDQGFSTLMPESIQAVVLGSLTNIAVSFKGPSLTMYTNGEEIYTVQREFVRGSVLRVFLGGQNDTDRAVYLARVRIATDAPATAPQGAPVSVPPAARGGPTPAPGPSTQTPPPASRGGGRGSGRAGTAPVPPAAASLPARSVAITGFTATGVFSGLPSRSVALSGFSASSVFGVLNPRTIAVPGISAAGVFGTLSPRTITVAGFSATGAFGSIAPRTIAVAGFSATGAFGSIAPRTVAVPGINARGVFTTLPPKTVAISGFTAFGTFAMLNPKTITLAPFAGAGVFSILAPRTVTVPGFSASGVFKTP